MCIPLCVIRRSVVRLLDLAELHRSGSVDADAAVDASSRTPVLGVVVKRRGGDTVGLQRCRCRPAGVTAVVGAHPVAGSSSLDRY